MNFITKPEPNTAYLVPLGAPIPSALTTVPLATGNLLNRLLPLAEEQPESDVLIPVDGADLYALDRIWSSVALRPSVVALLGVPGASYDPMFLSSVRALGIHAAEWETLDEYFSESSRRAQQVMDSRPDLTPGKGMTEVVETPIPQTTSRRPLLPGSTEPVNRRVHASDASDDDLDVNS